jgi:hypothetical protein
MLFGNTISYWLLVRLAIVAQVKITEGSKDSFYPRKLATANFFASQVLTRNHAYLATIISNSSFIEFAGTQSGEQFATD